MHRRIGVWTAAVLAGLAACLLGPGELVARAAPVADDGRVGVVTDLQGTALVRPAGRTRWSPVAPRTVLLPGDDVRTLGRGAHAAEIRLAAGGSLVLGPGAVAHLDTRTNLRLLEGDAEVVGAVGAPVTVAGPGGFTAAAAEKATVLRAERGTTKKLDEPPRWLSGYRSSTTDEWMGSLLAKVDGRNVPLTVGYHKVDVVVRDQIAETTVEQTFVNSTDRTLEGVFTFPLPAGASVSGFGMWIGEELVEADIVEKERARAIYEDIKARRKDPGLLEWSGGNLFTANVFPIFGRSEKRVRLRYTQVLPLEGSLVRYRYALRSELLRTHPLRQLQIKVAAQSSAPIVSASSPTHEVLTTKSANTATFEFNASEFTPDKDFEVVLGLDGAAPLRAVAHRRGEDGYLMVLLTPPDAATAKNTWKRDLVPEGGPLDLVLVADTSGSMGPSERKAQRAFLDATFALLGEKDRFRLLVCDANVLWLSEEPLAATDENVAKAFEFLDRRFSLGWTDLDGALAAVAAKAAPGTHVVYVGDGIGTSGDADPVALAQRIGRMTLPPGASIHAVAPGSSYEEGVLAAMGAKGAGSVRTTGDDPAKAATALLTEIASPSVKDLRVAFEGVRTARVYPERLPNIPSGTQQIVLGRFLPSGDGEQRGRVKVTGTFEGKPVEYDAEIVVAPGAEGTGNTFLPRLWARRHLDALLAEGRSPAIKDEIVSMSEQYGIITPYTSFLVLENDEDRERYGVVRRVAMRDGERFFTDARTTAATEALRDAMRNARSWRIGMRKSMLREIADLGRSLPLGGAALGFQTWTMNGTIGVGGGASGSRSGWPYGGGGGGGGGGDGVPVVSDMRMAEGAAKSLSDSSEFSTQTASDWDGESDLSLRAEAKEETWGPQGEIPPDSREPSDPAAPPESGGPATPGGAESLDEVGAFPEEPAFERARESAAYDDEDAGRDDGSFAKRPAPAASPMPFTGGFVGLRRKNAYRARSWPPGGWQGDQLRNRIPGLSPPPSQPEPPPEPAWDPEVKALLTAISEPAGVVLAPDVRLQILWRDGGVGPTGPSYWPQTTGSGVVTAERWLAEARQAWGEPWVQWLAEDRGILMAGTRLGRRRPGAEGDRRAWAALVGRAANDYLRWHAKWTAKIESRDGAKVVVSLTSPDETKQRIELTIDTEKKVVLENRNFYDGRPTGGLRSSEFVRVGGLWWAGRTESFDAEDRVTWQRETSVREIAAAEFDAAVAKGLAGQEDALFLGAANPTRSAAKQADHQGRATFADLLEITADHASWERWDDAWAVWTRARAVAETPTAKKPGLDWIEGTLLSMSRRGEQFAAWLTARADALAKSPGPAAHPLAVQVDQLAQSTGQPNTRLALIDVLARATDPADDPAKFAWESDVWDQQRAQLLAQTGRWGDAIKVWKAQWKARPEDPQRAMSLMNGYVSTGKVDEALELIAGLDLAKRPATDWMVTHMFQQASNVVWNANRYETALELADKWIAARPGEAEPYVRRLSALLALGKIEEFDAWIGAHLVIPTATQAGPERAAQNARLTAAVRQALCNDPYGGWHGNRTDPKWVRPLGAFARRVARDERVDVNVVTEIVQDYRWQRTDAHRELLAALRTDLAAAGTVETLAAPRLQQFVAWLAWDRNSVDAAVWRGVTDRVAARWRASKDEKDRPRLLAALVLLLDQHLEPEEAARVLREELAAAPAARVPGIAGALLTRLLRASWTQAAEDEAFALVPRLVSDDMERDARRWQFASASRWLARRLASARYEAALPPPVEREKLPRAEFRALQKKTRAESRSALAAHFLAAAKTAPDLLRPWFEIERLCLAAESGGDAKAVEAEARELLLSVPSPEGLAVTPQPGDEDDVTSDPITWTLRERTVLVLSYVALRRDAPEGLADRVEALFRERLEKDATAFDWRYSIFRLLVAQDRTDAVETALRSWIVAGRVESRWRRALGYVLAEKGKVKEASDQFEEVAKLGEMTEAEFVTLASWYLVLGDDVRRESALDRRYSVVDEWNLQSRVNRERWRVQSKGADGVPDRMDDEILRVIRAVLAKSSQPENMLWSVVGLYQATKDFRVLASLADGVIGHTPEAAYGFLRASWNIFGEVHEEATCDEIRARLEERRAKVTTDTDRRAVTLLLVLCERRAADVLNQRGPHAQRALDGLKSARQGTWLPGERRLMAEFLADLGKIPDAALATEQQAQLKDLHDAEKPGTVDRVRVAHALWRTAWAYDRRDEAIDGLVAALEEHRQAQGGRLPAEANDLADVIAGWHEAVHKFAAGEAWLVAETARQPVGLQKELYERRTFRLWVDAQRRDGTVSFGSGADLFKGAKARMEKALADHSPGQLDEVLGHYCELHVQANAKKVPGVAEDLVVFSRGLFVEILPRFGNQSPWRVQPVAQAIHDVAGALAGMTFYVERLEAEPSWRKIRGRGHDGWNYWGHAMAQWRREARKLGDLEPRLLAVVLAELERDLTSEESRGRPLYSLEWRDGFWHEKAGDFATVARRVVKEFADSPGVLQHTAIYLWAGLGLKDEAIAVLEDAAKRDRIREDGRWMLVQWEQELKRWAASLPHAEKLVAERPDNLDYRLANLRALHGVGRDADGRAMVDAAQKHFADLLERRRGGRRAQTRLADVCVECKWFDKAIVLYPLALTEERSYNRSGRANAELSRLYGQYSRCLSGAGRHDEAIDAASSAVVIWGATDANREGALQALREALAAIPELAAWEEKWESAAATDGSDAPVLRGMLGDLHLQRKEPDRALHHLLVARRIQPDDATVHAAIVRAAEMKQDAAGVADAMATSLHHLPRQPDLYPRLADVFKGLGRADDAERALTGLVESAPTEADGHQRLAVLRTNAGRHDEAAVQWRHIVRIRSADPAGWFELARSLARAGRKDEARAVLDEAARTPWGPAQRKAIESVSKEIEHEKT